MKIYLSADIEGVAGSVHRDECDHEKPDHRQFSELMTQEVLAACEGALEAGATEIWVKDAHYSGRNILLNDFPEEVKIIRGWSGHYLLMMQELDQSFDAVAMIGYHSRAGQDTNPLAHTFSSGTVASLNINGRYASEFLANFYAASMFRVPVVFVAGDQGLSLEIQEFNSKIHTFSTKEGVGDSVISLSPRLVQRKIKEGVKQALSQDLNSYLQSHPEHFQIELHFKTPTRAYRAAQYPGVKTVRPQVVSFESNDYAEILKMLLFTI
jgi:D-amino peptidase